MEVEVEGEDGSKVSFGNDEETVFGRGCGVNTDDRTVSRRHVSFQLDHSDTEVANARVSFHVIGKNPFWVFDGEVLRFFRKLEKGHLQLGHRFSFSANTPLWFTLNNIQHQPQPKLDAINVSEIDPVKEFGFLVMGHEFDNYPKGMIRNAKNWEWFLEEPRKDSEDEEDSENERRKMKRKRKLGKVNEDDDEWSGDNEEDKDLVANVRKGKLPRYSTRSKDSKGDMKAGKNKNSKEKKVASVDETVEEEDYDDETLGGFIVADEDDDREEDNDDEEDEEFEDDDEVDD